MAINNSFSKDQDYSVWTLLAHVRHAMFLAREKELKQYNLSARRSAVLFIIDLLGRKAIPAEISRWLFRDSHSVSEFLIRMEKEELVRKVKDLDKKNLVRVMLTKKGREAYHQSIKRESVHKIMSCLTKAEHKQLRALLLKLWDSALKELGMAKKPPFPPDHE